MNSPSHNATTLAFIADVHIENGWQEAQADIGAPSARLPANAARVLASLTPPRLYL